MLDTNVISEIMKMQPAPRVAAWVQRHPEGALFTTVVSKAEVFAGIALLPQGRRRSELEAVARGVFDIDFVGHVWPFDGAAALAYADVAAARRLVGREIGTFDLLIAAIARVHDATVVTRDIGGFESAGVALLDPWDPN